MRPGDGTGKTGDLKAGLSTASGVSSLPSPVSLYPARVMHRRLVAPLYRFVYTVFYLLIDLDRIDDAARSARLFSHNRFNLLAFHDRDHGDGQPLGLRPWAEGLLRQQGIELDGGRIRLLCMPRLLGFAFNPISLWYCEHRDGKLRAVIAEVRNTFGEKHSYVLASGGAPMAYEQAQDKDKSFHVSPFFDLVGRYRFLLSEPGERLRVAIHETREGGADPGRDDRGRASFAGECGDSGGGGADAVDDLEGRGGDPLGSAEDLVARRTVPQETGAAASRGDVMNRDDKRDNAGNYGSIMNRDGFSPDLPRALSSQGDLRGLGWSMRLALYMLSGMQKGSLDVLLPNDVVRHFEGSQPGPHGVWRIKNPGGLMRHVLASGEVGIGDSYLDDCWDSPDLARLLEVLYLNEPYYKGPFEKNWLGRLYGYWQHRRKANTKITAKKNIEHHYDLGNEFYKMWLDDTMAYSSAMFIEPTQTLQDAQVNKFKLMFERLDLRAEHTVLEIGSGWGGFAIYAATHAGCTVHSITLSQEQLAEARLRAQKAGVADKVSFEIRDYRDVVGQYDRVVSIEMYEAVGEEFWPVYFDAIARALKPGGLAAIQGITINPAIFDHYRTKRDFIQKYIFPGGMLCPPGRFEDLSRAAGMVPVEPKFYAIDYADTLAQWDRNVLAVRDKIVEQFDERFLRMWRYYLAYCECGFRAGSIDLMQITLRKP